MDRSKESQVFWKQREEVEETESTSIIETAESTEEISLTVATNLTGEIEQKEHTTARD